MKKIKVNFKMVVLKNGLPHGLALIEYKNPNNKNLSFSGIGIFDQGVLNNTPFICINEDGDG